MSGDKRQAGKGGRSAPDDGSGLGEDPLADADPLVDAFYRRDDDEGPQDQPAPARPAAPRPAPPRPAPERGSPPADREPSSSAATEGEPRRRPLRRGQSYRLVTFSFYEDDVERLDALLAEARRRGHRKASRSQIVRLALRQVDLDDLPDPI